MKRPPNSRCVFLSVLEDTTKMTAHSRATGLPDLAGDLVMHMYILIMAYCVLWHITTTLVYHNLTHIHICSCIAHFHIHLALTMHGGYAGMLLLVRSII